MGNKTLTPEEKAAYRKLALALRDLKQAEARKKPSKAHRREVRK